MQDGRKREVVSWKLSAAFFLMTPCGFERFCLQHAATECMQKSQYVRKTNEHGPKMVPKPFQIDPGGALEATWEPPLKQGASKTSFFMILAPFWDPLWDQFGVMSGIIFLVFF